jgi:hypothetical protein
MTQGKIILRDTPAGMKRRVPGRILEVALPNYRDAMPLVRSMPFVKSLEVSGEHLRVLVVPEDECADAEEQLGRALADAGFTVEHMRAVPTDLEMAFATLIPSADDLPRTDVDHILAVGE